MMYKPRYYETRWRALRDKTGHMWDVLKRTACLVLILTSSPHDASKEYSPSYHIKGLCNSRCRGEGDHVPYPQEVI